MRPTKVSGTSTAISLLAGSNSTMEIMLSSSSASLLRQEEGPLAGAAVPPLELPLPPDFLELKQKKKL